MGKQGAERVKVEKGRRKDCLNYEMNTQGKVRRLTDSGILNVADWKELKSV